jgi:HTH-type transcriptional regulator / antitoxin HigA
MNYIKIIKSKQEHEQAIARLMNLMDIDLVPGSAQANELDVLALLIERYEQKQFPMDPPNPIEAIKFRMEQQGLRKKDLVPYIGSASKVTEVLNGNRKLSLNMIRKLSEGLGISADILIREPAQKEASGSNINWDGFPLSEMRKRGYFKDFTGTLQELKEYSAELLTSFLSCVPNGFSPPPTMLRTSSHLRPNDKKTDGYSLWAWQVRILQHAQEELLPVNYQPGSIDLNWMQKLAQLSWSEQGPLLAKEYLNNHGIHLVFEPHLPRTYLDGAVCLSANCNPVVALTLRHDRLDNFWFTLMHELAHIALHLDGAKTWFIDDLDAESGDKQEQEADALAQAALLPDEDSNLRLVHDVESVRSLAQKLNISPCIIAGRLRYERNNHRLFGALFRSKVKSLLKCD